MKNKKNNIYIKFQLFYPILIALILSLVLFTFFMVRIAGNSIYHVAGKNMMLEVHTIKKMFELEKVLKLEKVKSNLKVANKLFKDEKISFSINKVSISAVNQLTLNKHKVLIKPMLFGGKSLLNSNTFPDQVHSLVGGTASVFQKIDSGYLRISTNVLSEDGQRAVGTYIPNSSEVVAAVEKGQAYYGRAYVVNEWYITAYKPIWFRGEIVGMLYVGNREKSIGSLRNTLKTLTLFKTGFPFVMDRHLNFVVSPVNPDKLIVTDEMKRNVARHVGSVFQYKSQVNKIKYLIASIADEQGDYIVVVVPTKQLTEVPVSSIIFSSIVLGSILVVLLIVLMFSTTTRRVHRLLNAIRLSNVKLRNTKEALRHSEENFETIFENSSDEIFVTDMQGNIIEVNNQAAKLLCYSKNELLNINFLDLMPLKFGELFLTNRSLVTRESGFLFDSEYVTKEGVFIPVEINSRVIEFNGTKVILSISRNLARRKEMEQKVLSAVIQTEEKERERFSKDMHDGIGPLLSTVKLYVNELGSSDIGTEEKKEFVNQINKMLDDAVGNIREISNNLMPRVIHKYGLVKALEAFCNKINQAGKIQVEFNADNLSEQLDKNVQMILFRVISELLTNTIKHANARKANIHLQQDGENILLTFTDNGIGFDSKEVMVNKNTGIGLKSIISRIKSINGTCEIISAKGEGFKIVIEI
ncbi:MAG: Cache 3/Cache 2 fusion domain-containing protein [Bacteroidales bacterium]|nr:Cache 3/Cache 2 fusion domain-containing protein [Bacteroidales bacterium]